MDGSITVPNKVQRSRRPLAFLCRLSLIDSRPRLPRSGIFSYTPAFPEIARARSSAGEHYVDIVGVTGSIPVAPTILYRGL